MWLKVQQFDGGFVFSGMPSMAWKIRVKVAGTTIGKISCYSVYRIFCFHLVAWPSKKESIVSMQENGTADSFGEGWIITSGSSLPFPLKFKKRYPKRHHDFPNPSCLLSMFDGESRLLRICHVWGEKHPSGFWRGILLERSNFGRSTLPKTCLAPNNWWLVDVSAFPREYFQVV